MFTFFFPNERNPVMELNDNLFTLLFNGLSFCCVRLCVLDMFIASGTTLVRVIYS